jgi:mannan endo-1,4-beta-mannosidase
MTSSATRPATRSTRRKRSEGIGRRIGLVIGVLTVISAALAIVAIKPWATNSFHPTKTVRYLGVYEPDAPYTYAGIDQFAQATGRQPNLVSYYSIWLERFQTGFAASAAKHGAVTVVQIDPKNISLASIVTGRYDTYLRSYASEVKAFRGQVILSFGHEMNGNWYSWANQHSSASDFVAAWRHVVGVFRAVGARNATWLWTVNVIDPSIPIPDPAPWWPGSSYVNWVGIDGYYYLSSQSFAQVFGPTIVAVLKLTHDPIIIAETGAAPDAGQPAKIDDLFAGIRSYGLAGFIWFDQNTQGRIWRISNPSAFLAFRQNAREFVKPPAPTPTRLSSASSPASRSHAHRVRSSKPTSR